VSNGVARPIGPAAVIDAVEADAAEEVADMCQSSTLPSPHDRAEGPIAGATTVAPSEGTACAPLVPRERRA
jgi:hypothetical protein